MAKIEGTSGAVIAEVEPNSLALRTTRRPIEALGHYKLSVETGLLTAIAAAGEAFQFRWTNNTRFALLHYVRFRAQGITGFTAAQEIAFEAALVSAFTVAGTGGTQFTPDATRFKKRGTAPTSLVQEVRVATTAALGAGTKTINDVSFLMQQAQELAAAAAVPRFSLEANFNAADEGDYPIVLGVNEGFIVRNMVALGAAGTVRLLVEAAWAEIDAY